MNCVNCDGEVKHRVSGGFCSPSCKYSRKTKAVRDMGFDVAPNRYVNSRGRETIDRMRDWCLVLATEIPDLKNPESLGDYMFHVHCRLSAMKYRDRAGKSETIAEDLSKAYWYEAMAKYILGEAKDPRNHRPDFHPYRRRVWKE